MYAPESLYPCNEDDEDSRERDAYEDQIKIQNRLQHQIKGYGGGNQHYVEE
jgi:hypothetical protein